MWLNKKWIFIVMIFIAVFMVYMLRGIISRVMYSEYLYSRDLTLIYLPPVVSAIFIAFALCILFDLYFLLFTKRLIKHFTVWVKNVILNYAVLIALYTGILVSYFYVVYTIIKYYKHIMVSPTRFPMFFSSLIILLALVYIGVASIKYILMYRSELSNYSVWRRFVKILGIFWSNKGTFFVWLLIGFLIVGLIGFIADTLTTALPAILFSLRGLAVLLATSFIDSIILYFYYTYFVKNYIQDIIMGLGIKGRRE